MDLIDRWDCLRLLSSALLGLLFCMLTAADVAAQVVSSASPAEQSYRLRHEAITELHRSAKSAHEQRDLSEEAYRGVVTWLRSEQLELFEQVHKVRFQNITEHNYWHRGVLKFPTSLQQEAERLGVAGSKNAYRKQKLPA